MLIDPAMSVIACLQQLPRCNLCATRSSRDSGLRAAFITTLECPSSSSAILRPRSRSMGSKCSTASILFTRGRIYPAFQVNASAGADVYQSERLNVRLQADGQSLTNVLNVIDFGGLFSGNAIGPSRSFSLRLTSIF